MKQLVVASTFYQCLSLAAAVDAGVLPGAEERILVLASSSQVPELSPRLQDHHGFGAVADRFDRVVDFAALVYPRRPVQFSPRAVELITWQRLLRSHWGLGKGPVQILLDSVQVNPGPALASIFDEAELYAHSDGLMTYAPTRKALPRHLAQRMVGLVCVDLVPGLVPRLLAEHDVRHLMVPRDAVGQLIKEVSGAEAAVDRRPTALLLGQYLGSLQLLTRAQESALHQQMVVEAAARGARVCVFKLHPSAPPGDLLELSTTAERHGVELVVDGSPEIAEITVRRREPTWVISCFSTGLATARYVLGVEAVAVGTGGLLTSLTPYENSNRVPLVLADALFAGGGFVSPDEAADGQPHEEAHGVGEVRGPGRDLQALVDTVAYCMQPRLQPAAADRARTYLATVADDEQILTRYFRRRRLTALGLPGALPPRPTVVRLRHWIGRRIRSVSGAPSR